MGASAVAESIDTSAHIGCQVHEAPHMFAGGTAELHACSSGWPRHSTLRRFDGMSWSEWRFGDNNAVVCCTCFGWLGLGQIVEGS